jgi:hypothetical protein
LLLTYSRNPKALLILIFKRLKELIYAYLVVADMGLLDVADDGS